MKLNQGWHGREVISLLLPSSCHSSPLPPQLLWNVRAASNFLSGLATISGFNLSIKMCDRTLVNKSAALPSPPSLSFHWAWNWRDH